MAGMKSDVKKFLKQKGVSTITVNKKTLKLSQATYRTLVGKAIKLGYGQE